MYDSLLDEDPDIQERVARAKIEGQQKAALILVETRFPALIGKAQQVIAQLSKPDELNLLIKQIALAPDEDKAEWALDTLAA